MDPLLTAIRDVPDFPKPGIMFKDITPILSDGRLLRETIDRFVAACDGLEIQKIAGVDARGFMFGAAMADRMGLGFVPIRKKGKLPWKTLGLAYKLEYGEAALEIHADAFLEGERVTLVDDLLATGGTAAAAIKLVQQTGAEVVQAQFLMELEFLAGRKLLAPVPVKSVLVV